MGRTWICALLWMVDDWMNCRPLGKEGKASNYACERERTCLGLFSLIQEYPGDMAVHWALEGGSLEMGVSGNICQDTLVKSYRSSLRFVLRYC